jgi:hypothetical protein
VQDIERAADHSVGRGVGFAALAVAVTMVGLIPYPALALQTGATLATLIWAVLRLKALRAPGRPYRRTEVWLMLEPRPRLAEPVLQRLIGGALQAALDRYAKATLLAATAMLLGSFVVPAGTR